MLPDKSYYCIFKMQDRILIFGWGTAGRVDGNIFKLCMEQTKRSWSCVAITPKCWPIQHCIFSIFNNVCGAKIVQIKQPCLKCHQVWSKTWSVGPLSDSNQMSTCRSKPSCRFIGGGRVSSLYCLIINNHRTSFIHTTCKNKKRYS